MSFICNPRDMNQDQTDIEKKYMDSNLKHYNEHAENLNKVQRDDVKRFSVPNEAFSMKIVLRFG